MNLKSYLKSIEKCPDIIVEGKYGQTHKLTYLYGVYDNFAIFLKTDFENLIEHLKSSNYTPIDNIEEKAMFVPKGKRNYRFNYNPGTVLLQVADYIFAGAATGGSSFERENEEVKKHFEKQTTEFNMTIMLHNYQKEKIKDISAEKAISLVVLDIGEYSIKNSIPLCMPDSKGWQEKRTRDYSRIIYYL